MIDPNQTYYIFFDGASPRNPGPSGAGYIIYEQNEKTVFKNSNFLGTK